MALGFSAAGRPVGWVKDPPYGLHGLFRSQNIYDAPFLAKGLFPVVPHPPDSA
jgi:hypothetical protein